MSPPFTTPPERIRPCNAAPLRLGGPYVLYWMVAARRTRSNFALQRAVEQAVALRRPLVVLEALRCDYPWASDRLHRFVLDGMADNARALQHLPVTYHAYVEPRPHDGRGLLEALAREACLVVTDDSPCSFVPRMIATAAARCPVRLEAVDGNGLVPMRLAETTFVSAHAFRRFLQRVLPEHLRHLPRTDPLARAELPGPVELPREVTARWPSCHRELLAGGGPDLAALPIDHAVAPVPFAGGARTATRVLERFVEQRLDRYAAEGRHPDAEATSGLSPYLHFGHVSPHAILARVARHEDWDASRLAGRTDGARSGFWNMSASAEAFLDQLVTWRELGFNLCARRDDHDRYESLPDWARRTLREHAGDAREHLYDRAAFEQARTHDELWNAAQRQLLAEGRIHNHLRMLWGKKILEWSRSPRRALATMITLNDRYAVDGRDPNSYSGIFWVLGRYDRPWGPERPVLGKVRYMTSGNTARKLRVGDYLARWGPGALVR